MRHFVQHYKLSYANVYIFGPVEPNFVKLAISILKLVAKVFWKMEDYSQEVRNAVRGRTRYRKE